MYPASTTKIMTAILAIENCDLTEKATVSQNAVSLVPSGYTNAKLVPGEKLSVEDLLYALMLNSANEAANVLAEHVSGSIDKFVVLMNEKAKELGCKSTNFLNANGMHNENHYTTAEDLAIIANYCMENETFKKIVSTYTYELPTTELYTNNDRIMTNTNALINPKSQYYYEYAIGVKTGFTTQAGNCLVSCAEKDGIQLICVTLKAGSTTNNSSYRFADSKTLLEYGFENFSLQTLIEKDTIIDNIEVLNATKGSKNINIVTKESISDFVANDIDVSNADINIQLKENLSAPIYAGDVVGTVTYTINDKNYTTDLVSETSAYTATNYTSYFLIIGLILLIVSIILIPKKKNGNHFSN
jgi:D-alanyl-D-alanine carboxypeptidase